ncbi:MAG: aminomethyl-transferring glycine dehydrogenase subunit GcvPA [Candidatus Bathyarchaeia archaeon]
MKKLKHPYLPTSGNFDELLRELNIDDVDDLFTDVPREARLSRHLRIPGPMSEFEIIKRVKGYLKRDTSALDIPMFLGAGVWPHQVPAPIDEIVSRGEFLTAYTPYQPEVSQGLLQALFEYQSLICELMGMDVANSSMYDWATSLGEAARMAYRITHRKRFVIPKFIHPERRRVLDVMTEPAGMIIEEAPQDSKTGGIVLEELEDLAEGASGIYVEIPSYMGFLELRMDEISEVAHSKGALTIIGVDPTVLGLVKPPGAFDADIAIGEGQPLGLGMNYGGPLLGLFACKKEYARQMPGRIIGATKTKSGKRAFCMVLQTREQHIRREKATSNICTNNALCAISAAIYLSLLGPSGIKKLSEIILAKTNYAINCLKKVRSLKTPFFDAPHYKEFTVNFGDLKVSQVNRKLLRKGIHGGKDLSEEFPELGESMLLCMTEFHSKTEIDMLVDAMQSIKGYG